MGFDKTNGIKTLGNRRLDSKRENQKLMKITFADSFWKSLRTMNRHQTWWYKTYAVFRYKIPMFFENFWFFRKQLWEFRSWDYTFNLRLLGRSLEKTAHTLEHYGQEVEEHRMKRVNKIKSVLHIINSINEGLYIDRAEQQLAELKNLQGWTMEREDTIEEREHNKKIFELARQIEDSEWNELWDILKGQNIQEYKNLMNSLSDEEKKNRDVWNEWNDGSGMKGWWD